jgi:hypothetical protein
MGLLRRAGLAVAITCLTAGAGVAQEESGGATTPDVLRSRVERRFTIVPLHGGVLLQPARASEQLKTVEIRNGAIAIDGQPASGQELRDRLGADADLVLQVSYLSLDDLARWFGPAPPPKPEPPPPMPKAEEDTTPREPIEETTRTYRRSTAKIHIGGSVDVDEDELVTEPVVAIGGSVNVRGRVEDDVVAIGGSVILGPKAYVRGDVTAVGGRVERAQGAVVTGESKEIGFGPHIRFSPEHLASAFAWNGFSSWFRFVGTMLRIAVVLLLAAIFIVVAQGPAERIGERASREPWLSAFVGLLAQVMFVPVLVVTIVVLAVSIIGIPLLLLVPFAILALMVAGMLGFAGVALRIGRWAVGDRHPALVALVVGVVLVSALSLLARVLWLLPAPIGVIAFVVGAVGVFVEYMAWTVGFGAALLTRFGTRGPDQPAPASQWVPPIPVTPMTTD